MVTNSYAYLIRDLFPNSLKVVFYVCDLWNYTCFYSLASFVFQESLRRSTIIWGACRPKRLWRQVDKAWWRFSRIFENVGMSLRKRGWRIELNVEKMQIGGLTELENLKYLIKGHSLCKQCLHNLQLMKKGSSSPNLARADISCQFMKTRSLCRTV